MTDVALLEKQNRNKLIDALIHLGVSRIQVHFDGQGDSGSVCGYEAYDTQGKPMDLPSTPIEYGRFWTSYKWNEPTAKAEFRPEIGTLEQALSTWCERELDLRHIDWYNNDGGYGHLEVILHPTNEGDERAEISLDVNIRYTSSENSVYDVSLQ